VLPEDLRTTYERLHKSLALDDSGKPR